MTETSGCGTYAIYHDVPLKSVGVLAPNTSVKVKVDTGTLMFGFMFLVCSDIGTSGFSFWRRIALNFELRSSGFSACLFQYKVQRSNSFLC